jgi:peptide-methionine (R)-S-oxide reductase
MFQELKEELTRRRALLITPFAFAALFAITSRKSEGGDDTPGDTNLEVTIVQFDDSGKKLGTARVKKVFHSDADWRKMLTIEQYYVTRHKNTDLPYSGTYFKMHDPGIFRCIGCGNTVFSSETKYDSGTGWPSFWAPIAEENIRTRTDDSLLVKRVEVLCKRCDSHLGHVFDDGPEPTHLRYCMNESALHFIPRPK